MAEFTLSYCVYDSKGELSRFFIPSPQSLRFSQLVGYNDLIAAMLMDVPDGVVHKEHVCHAMTLKMQLEQSMQVAIERKDVAVTAMNKELLGLLPVFSRKWLAEYERTKLRRNLMDVAGTNHYLTNRTQRFFESSRSLPTPDKVKQENSASIVHKGEKVYPEIASGKAPPPSEGRCCVIL